MCRALLHGFYNASIAAHTVIIKHVLVGLTNIRNSVVHVSELVNFDWQSQLAQLTKLVLWWQGQLSIFTGCGYMLTTGPHFNSSLSLHLHWILQFDSMLLFKLSHCLHSWQPCEIGRVFHLYLIDENTGTETVKWFSLNRPVRK